MSRNFTGKPAAALYRCTELHGRCGMKLIGMAGARKPRLGRKSPGGKVCFGPNCGAKKGGKKRGR